MEFLVYKLLFSSGKVYFGKTNDLPRRIGRHKSDSRKLDNKLYRAIRKYGFPEVHVMGTGLSEDAAFAAEQRLILAHDSRVLGYNSTNGGEGLSGFSHSQESRDVIRAKVTAWHATVGHSEEQKQKWSEMRKGRIGPRLGAATSPEAKSKMAFAKLSRPIFAYRVGATNEFFYFRLVKIAAQYI